VRRARLVAIPAAAAAIAMGIALPGEAVNAQDLRPPIPAVSRAIQPYPHAEESRPALPSPCRTADGTEYVTVRLAGGRWALVGVTVENGKPYCPTHGLDGKGNQLRMSAPVEFHTFARTGLHSEAEIDAKTMITGRPLWLIDLLARPGALSGEGFIADDESIRSVLKGDDRLVRALGLTHPALAFPLFHLWNLVRLRHGVEALIYNDREVRFEAEGTKGYQESIFHDEIQGSWGIRVWREVGAAEKELIAARYRDLDPAAQSRMISSLSGLRFGEMEPYYIMRYGFYEGHTGWRADPLAIAFIFGLKSLDEITGTFGAELPAKLSDHFKGEITPR